MGAFSYVLKSRQLLTRKQSGLNAYNDIWYIEKQNKEDICAALMRADDSVAFSL